ncbi:MAG TPA: hypothetical protein VJ327_11330 [Patescibacteria group bacterium]|nr:hypothetical protein [Patescibacteria group bacterium]
MDTVHVILLVAGVVASLLLLLKPALKLLVAKTKTHIDDEVLDAAVEIAENIPKPKGLP